jgi:hypothetical protein
MTQHPRHFASFISVTTFTKFLLNMARRLAYPFAPEFARSLGTELSAVTTVIAVNQATALFGPV